LPFNSFVYYGKEGDAHKVFPSIYFFFANRYNRYNRIMKQFPLVMKDNNVKKVKIIYPSRSLISQHGLTYLSNAVNRSVNKLWKDLRTVPESFIHAYIETLTEERATYVIVFGYGVEKPNQEFVRYEINTYDLTHNLTPEKVIKKDE
jgi:hypothetical protein